MFRMTGRGKWSAGAMALAAVGVSIAWPVDAPAAPGGGAPATAPAAAKTVLATTQDLGGEGRCLSYLSTDKPIYRENEKVYARAVLMNAATHVPLADNQPVVAAITVLGPRGETVASGQVQSENSIVGYSWTVPAGAAGGEYTLKMTYPYQGYAPAERKFDVRVYRAPRLKSQVTFAREGYGPGDKVTASVHSERAEGGFPAGAKVQVIARVDDRQVWTGPATIDAKGDATATFDLPKTIERGEGTLAFAITDGGVVETASKTIPILLQTLDLEIYPEGGDAVAGVNDRFYFEARTPAKKPADLVGAIYDSKGTKVADVKSEHEGRGRFEFPTSENETYTLKVTEPAGIKTTWTLPPARTDILALKSQYGLGTKGQPVKVTLQGRAIGGKYKVTLKQREKDVADPVEVSWANGMGGRGPVSQEIALSPKDDVDGVLTVTVWNEKGEPIAERLIYRQPAHEVKVNVTPDQSTYAPGGKVKLDISTTDETGKSISAMVGLTVTDDTVLEMVEKREQAPRLPAMVLLEPEVKELADAQVYLQPKNTQAPRDIDLLLGTQGWRRFAVMKPEDFMAKYGDDAKRVLAYMKPEPQVRMFGMAQNLDAAGVVAPRALLMNRAVQRDDPIGEIAKDAVQKADQAKELEDRAIALPEAAAMPPMAPLPADAGADKDQQQAKRMMAPLIAGGGRRGGGGGGGFGGRGMLMQGGGGFVVVREFAHEDAAGWTPSQRSDFAETVYWNAGIKTDDSGHATASFALSDNVTNYRVLADAFSKTGALGANTASTVNAVQPFFIEPKLPLEVTAGDVIELPVSIKNNTAGMLDHLSLTVHADESLKVEMPATDGRVANVVSAGQSVRRMFTITVGDKTGDIDVSIDASAGTFSDHVMRKLRVKPKGFRTALAFGGLLDSATPAKKQIMVPNSVVPNSMKTFVTVYPSPMANLTDAVAALLQEPNGCFEQTSSTNYPLAMAQTYFTTHQGVDPKLAAQGAELLSHGYQKLIAFECTTKGYEWFGGSAPGHEALTAYGLMEFNDMKKAGLATVDDQMIARTRTWLISREEPTGGFERNQKAVDSFGGAPELTTNAYIVWALLQAGETPETLAKQIAFVRDGAKASQDSYVLALAANICAMAKDGENAKFFMKSIAEKQNKDGMVEGGTTSITRSGGQALGIETTALSTLAWLQDKDFTGQVQNAMKFLADSCKGGRFGSTQSTILALKAIVAYDQSMAHPKAPGRLTLMIDDKTWGDPVDFTAETKGTLEFKDFASELPPGPHTVDLRMADGSQMPFSLGVNFNSVTPAADTQCKLRLSTRLRDAQLAEGGITEEMVDVTNRSDSAAASPVAIIGVPGGLEVRHEQLKELVKAGKIDAYEVNGREVVLYWREIKPGVKDEVALSLTASVPGTYTAPASRAYEYYTDEFKQWVEGTTVTITPK